MSDTLDQVNQDITNCNLCPRLRNHCRSIAETKRRAYRNEEYWGRPVPGFGDRNASLLVVGLAPAAHGANRTGRMFTGDSSGDWLYRALYRFGFATKPESIHRNDGLRLTGAYITAVGRCAPPQNKLKAEEIRACRPFLERELRLLTSVKVVLCLGRVAFDTYRRIINEWGWLKKESPPKFAHGASYPLGDGRPLLLTSYHPSRQNTQTGRLTEAMLDDVMASARRFVDDEPSAASSS